MKQKHKRFLTRALALGMTLCLSVQMLPVEALAVESQVAQTDSEIEDLQNKIADLEQQVEDLLGRPLEEVYETSPDSDVDPWDAYETDEVSSVLMSIDDVLAITEEVTEEKTLSEGLATIGASAFFNCQEDIDAIYELSDIAEITWWHAGAVDIVPKGISKAKGIDEMLRHWGVSLEESLAIGDGENDVDMLRHCAIGVAMGNAANITKEAADYVTDDIDEDGLYNALKHFELI